MPVPKRYVKERGTEPPVYCPIETDNRTVITGFNLIGFVPNDEQVIGEFWYDENCELHVGLYTEESCRDS